MPSSVSRVVIAIPSFLCVPFAQCRKADALDNGVLDQSRQPRGRVHETPWPDRTAAAVVAVQLPPLRLVGTPGRLKLFCDPRNVIGQDVLQVQEAKPVCKSPSVVAVPQPTPGRLVLHSRVVAVSYTHLTLPTIYPV